MKALFIGGTGIISTAITDLLAKNSEWELTLLNRGTRNSNIPSNVKTINASIYDEAAIAELLKDESFDVVAQFIAFGEEAVKRDIRLFKGKTKQYIFISSASAYQKPLSNHVITESTPLSNPYWKYSRDKIKCEETLLEEYRANGFPVTIVRPSHTYSDFYLPIGFHSPKGGYHVLKRLAEGRPVIVHGDGNTLWTLTHNTDFAKAFVGLMGNIHAIGESFHITSDESLTWNQIYTIIANAVGKHPNLVHIATDALTVADAELDGPLNGDKSVSVVFDNSKVKKVVPDYVATRRFDQAVHTTVNTILNTPELQIDDPEYDKWYQSVIDYYQSMVANIPKLPNT